MKLEKLTYQTGKTELWNGKKIDLRKGKTDLWNGKNYLWNWKNWIMENSTFKTWLLAGGYFEMIEK